VRRVNLSEAELEPEDEHDRPGYARRSKLVDEEIGADLIGGSIYELEEGERVCPYHYHYGVEEWLYVIAGTPTLREPGGEQLLRPGDVVCFPPGPDGAHTVHGPGRVLMLSAERWPGSSSTPTATRSARGRGPGAHTTSTG
jgi:uncharacterized cupin superfamily protein